MSAPQDLLAGDRAAREAALDAARSFIVEAPAGSGKTTLLIQRFLTLLARVARPEALLAITFTRKAAAEMRDKLIGALARAEANDPPKHAADATTLALARAVLAVDAARGWELLRQPGRLRIQTIDSLNHWLAARLPVLSRAGAPLRVAERPKLLYLDAARRTLAELESRETLAEPLARVLEHLDNDVDKLEPLLAEMLARREAWLRHLPLALPADREPGLRRRLEASLAALIEDALGRAHALVPAAERGTLFALARRAAARHPRPDEGLRALAALPAGAELPVAAAAREAWQALAALLVTAAGTFRARLDKNGGFPPTAGEDKAAFLALIDQLRAVAGLEAALGALKELPPPAYDEGQWQVLLALRHVLLHAASELGVAFARDGEVDHGAVQHAALEALGGAGEPTELTLALDHRIEHILVDEFQDTSAGQVALLERLTGGWVAGDGRTLFLVGDPMQSIYAFRGTEVGLFLRVKRAGLGEVVLDSLALSANFRSRPALVDWFNAAFPSVLAPAEDYARGAVPYAPALAVREPEPRAAVAVELLDGAGPAAEGREVARLVALERAARPGARIAVLARNRAALGHVARALGEAGVRFTGVELVPLADRPAVRDLIALTRALAHPDDRIAWLACLRAPWCGLELDALATLADDAAPLPALLADEGRRARLAPEARARLEATLGTLEAARAERGRRPLAATVEAAWLALGGPATLEDAADLGNAEAFFAELASLERAGDLDDPARLADALEDLYAAPAEDADPALELMTVHTAKGLEWDVVFVVGLGRAGRAGEAPLLDWLEFPLAGRGLELGLVLAPHRAGASSTEPLERFLRGLRREREQLELARLAYVAATRAMERLVLIGHVRQAAQGGLRAPLRGTLLGSLWPALAATPARTLAAAEPWAAGPARLVRHAPGWQAPPAEAALVELADPPPRAGPAEFEFEWVGAVARHVGTLVHEALERAARPGATPSDRASDARRWRRRLVELGLPEEALEGALERIARALEGTWQDPRGQWLFDRAHVGAASELELSGGAGGRVQALRIDRTFIDPEGVRWIVDFKTSVHEGADREDFLDRERERYRGQLEQYGALMRALDPGRPIRLGLYFPMLAGWRDWAYAP